MLCALIQDLLGRSLHFPPGFFTSAFIALVTFPLLCSLRHTAFGCNKTGAEASEGGGQAGEVFWATLPFCAVLFSFFFFSLGIGDAVEKAEKTAGLILLPQAGMQTKNNVTAGNAITPV